MDFIIENMKEEDWLAVQIIHQEGIATGNATFEVNAPDWDHWDKSHLTKCRLVAKVEENVLGWVALSPVSNRCVYRGVAEVSLYVKESSRGQGIGKMLLEAAMQESERIGIWTLQSGTFPENTESIALQKSCGFREIGIREKFGCMNNRWRDVILMERRSKVVGV